MNTLTASNTARDTEHWYLARFLDTRNNRETLFGWLEQLHIVPWTPLMPAAGKPSVESVFPGYFFLRMPLNCFNQVKRHSLFLGYVHFGPEIHPVPVKLVAGLMKRFPDDRLSDETRRKTASQARLSRAQYRRLVAMTQNPRAMSREALLMELLATEDLFSPSPT